jgi:hypothetical protein
MLQQQPGPGALLVASPRPGPGGGGGAVKQPQECELLVPPTVTVFSKWVQLVSEECPTLGADVEAVICPFAKGRAASSRWQRVKDQAGRWSQRAAGGWLRWEEWAAGDRARGVLYTSLNMLLLTLLAAGAPVVWRLGRRAAARARAAAMMGAPAAAAAAGSAAATLQACARAASSRRAEGAEDEPAGACDSEADGRQAVSPERSGSRQAAGGGPARSRSAATAAAGATREVQQQGDEGGAESALHPLEQGEPADEGAAPSAAAAASAPCTSHERRLLDSQEPPFSWQQALPRALAVLRACGGAAVTEEQLLAADPVLRRLAEVTGANIPASLCIEGYLDVVSAEDGRGGWEAWYHIA